MGARPYLVHGYECFVSSLYLSYLTFSLHTYVLCFQGIQRRAAELLVLAASRSNVMSIVDRVLSHVAANITRYLNILAYTLSAQGFHFIQMYNYGV